MTPSGSFFMEDYSEIIIPVSSEEQSSLFIASLTALGFEGFVEEATILKAYIPTSQLNQAEFNNWCTRCEVLVQQNLVKPNNWNQQWESNFQPVKVENFAVVRASFHNPIGGVEHDIIINPKMSFGTGHHATTYMMIDQMRGIDFWHKRVLDFGTGTGVLAILSKKMGATYVAAIDNDSWSIENATENIQRNRCKNITPLLGDAALIINKKYDIILANINRNILLQDIPTYSNALHASGVLILSGFYKEDLPLIIEKCSENKLTFDSHLQKGKWIGAKFVF